MRRINQFMNRHAGKLLLVGMGASALYNWHLWRRDKNYMSNREELDPFLPLDEWPALPKINALVPAWNEADHIEAHIHSFLNLRYPNKELVLVAGGVDGTYQMAKLLSGDQVKVLQQFPGEGKQKALQRGLKSVSYTHLTLPTKRIV